MRIAAGTDPGKQREKNEDCYKVIEPSDGVSPVLILIADGMGGYNSGEVASSLAVEAAADILQTNMDKYMKEPLGILKLIEEAISLTNSIVFQKSMEGSEYYGMGTTLITAVIHGEELFIGNIGDSRVYIASDGELRRITQDHSLIEELMRNGTITKEEAENHPKKNIITKAIGCSESIQADTYRCKLRSGDKLLFCTDGLSNMIKEDELYSILKQKKPPEMICKEVIDTANELGGTDNITAVIVEI